MAWQESRNPMIKKYPISQPTIGDKEAAYVLDAVQSGWVSSLGPYIEKFENAFAGFCHAKYALTTSNGTTGLHLALLACGIGPGDEVIIPDLSFIATANAVTYTGAIPVFVDIEESTLAIDPLCIERAITPNTKAVIPVHLYGHPANMGAINTLAKKYNLAVIEDAAEAHGATYQSKPVGALGSCGVFSFYGNKIITTGEGGMIVTNDPDIYERAKILRDHAMSPNKRYWHNETGYNYRMTNIQAALGLAQLEQIDSFIEKRMQILAWYKNALGEHENIRLNREVSWANGVPWIICAEIANLDDVTRSALMESLRLKGIDTRPYFYPMSDMPMFEVAATEMAHAIAKKGINLPTYLELTKSDIDHISGELVKSILELDIR